MALTSKRLEYANQIAKRFTNGLMSELTNTYKIEKAKEDLRIAKEQVEEYKEHLEWAENRVKAAEETIAFETKAAKDRIWWSRQKK